jgi:hypothetical protein
LPDSGRRFSPDHIRWIHPRYSFFLPVEVLRRAFRGKFVTPSNYDFNNTN